MRELKFRIWDGKKYDDHDWHINTKGNLCAWDHSGCEPLDDNYPIIIEQYTGIKDKTGKEIYEGDICKNNIKKTLFIVKYGLYDIESRDGWVNSSHLGFYLYRIDEPVLDTLTHVSDIILEIIGNIHESPELLEKI